MFQRAGRRLAPKAMRSPFAILGVAESSTEEQIKERYHELARKLHPDMPTGDARKFKEVNAAYTILKARKAKGDQEEFTAGAEAYEDAESEEYREQRRQRHRPQPTAADLMWAEYSKEIILLAVSWVFAFLYHVHRNVSLAREARQRNLERAAAAQGPDYDYDQLLEEARQHMTTPAELPEISERSREIKDTHDQVKLDMHRKSGQRFADLREFLLVFDTDNVTERRAGVHKLAPELLDEQRIAARCPVVRHIDTHVRPKAYDEAAMPLMHDIRAVRWDKVDTAPATVLMVEGVRRIKAYSPADHRITLFEYRAEGDVPRCVAAVINDKYPSYGGRVQRVLVSGSEELQPRRLMEREDALQSGALRRDELRMGEQVPIRTTGA